VLVQTQALLVLNRVGAATQVVVARASPSAVLRRPAVSPRSLALKVLHQELAQAARSADCQQYNQMFAAAAATVPAAHNSLEASAFQSLALLALGLDLEQTHQAKMERARSLDIAPRSCSSWEQWRVMQESKASPDAEVQEPSGHFVACSAEGHSLWPGDSVESLMNT
jgi:hypothetical protein